MAPQTTDGAITKPQVAGLSRLKEIRRHCECEPGAVSAGGVWTGMAGEHFSARAATGETISLVSSSACWASTTQEWETRRGPAVVILRGLGRCNSPTGAHSRAMLAGRASILHPAARFDLFRTQEGLAAGSCSRPSARYHFRIEPRLKFEVMMLMSRRHFSSCRSPSRCILCLC